MSAAALPVIIATVDPVPPSAPPALILSDELAAAVASAQGYAKGATSARTQAEYEKGFRLFSAWCERHGAWALPAHPVAVSAYLAELADGGRKASTVDARAAAIAFMHKQAGHVSPTQSPEVRATIRGIRNRLGTKPTKKAPATAEHVRRILKKLPDTVTGKRDAALIALGFGAALRRSELVALDVEHIERTPEGLIVHITRSKTDQAGAGHQVTVINGSKIRPGQVLDAWLSAAGIAAGPIFRQIRKGGAVTTDRLAPGSVAAVLKAGAESVGLDPRFFAGHSLRSGFVTSALANGADVLKVMSVTRHSQVDTLKEYDQRAQAFKDHAGRAFL